MQALELKIPPPVVALIAAYLMWMFSRVLPFGFRVPAGTWMAVFFALAGPTVAIAGVVSFRRAKTTVNPMRVSAASSLVTGGVYARTRNPMYLGLLLVLVGWSIYLANAAAFLVLPLFDAYIGRFQIAPEERALQGIFGEAFRSYMSTTRRWI